MEAVFLKILNMSMTASWVILTVILLRLLLKKAPKWIMGILWGFVAIRLIVPFSLESIFSLIPSAEPIPENIFTAENPVINSGIPSLNQIVNPLISNSLTPDAADSINPIQAVMFIISVIWIVGVAGMLLYTLISYLRIKSKVQEAIRLKENIWICDHISTPFILGIFRPRIYLPSSMNEADMEFVISHEKAHLKRKDHIWKPLGFLLLAVYWFNPLLWAAYILLCKDIELACDEKVIRQQGAEIKKPYSNALINCSGTRKMISACPLAFGETGVKERVKGVLSYKKPAFWVILAAVIVCIVTAVCLLTNPKPYDEYDLDDELKQFLDTEIMAHHQSNLTDANFSALDYDILKIDRSLSDTTLYMWVYYEEYTYPNGKLQAEASAHTPTVITVTNKTALNKNGLNNYELREYWEPRDGSYYENDIKEKFPEALWAQALDSERYQAAQEAACRKIAEEYFRYEAKAENWGISMNVIFQSDNEFDIVIKHSSKEAAVSGTITTSPEYEIRGRLQNGETIPFGKYMRDVFNYDYAEREFAWDAVLYTVRPDETLTMNCHLTSTYGKLPAGNYVLCKPITLTAENGESTTIIHTVNFDIPSTPAIGDADNSTNIQAGSNPYFNAEVIETGSNHIVVKPDPDSDELKTAGKIAVSLDVVSKVPVPEFQTGDRVRVVYNGEIAETYPAKINNVFAIYLLSEDGTVLSPTPRDLP